MSTIPRLLLRLRDSAVVWSWLLNGFRLASGLLLLPLLLHRLSEADLGMYYVFLGLVALLPIVDSAFSFNISRSVGFAMGGARQLHAQGLDKEPGHDAPNFPLLWDLLAATRVLYRSLALATLALLGLVGTVIVGWRVGETTSTAVTWWAWALTLLSAGWEIYSGWWNVFLRGMNEVLASSRLAVVAYALRLVIACGLLLGGGGLLSVPIAALLSGFVQRELARRHCLKLLSAVPPPSAKPAMRALLATMWPNCWRVGLQLLSGYLAANVYAVLCLRLFGLGANAQYGLSVQIISLITGMATVWTYVKWPLAAQLRARQDDAGLRRLLWPRVWLQSLTFLALAAIAVVIGQPLLDWWGTDKKVLPTVWLTLLALNGFLDTRICFWTILLATENRVPSLWPTVATNLFSLVLATVLIYSTSLGLGALVLAPLVAGGMFGYWYWPLAGARNLRTTWLRFTFSRSR